MKLTKESIFLAFSFFFLLFPFVAFQWKYDGYELPKYIFLITFGIIFGILFLITEKIKLPHFSVSIFFSFFLISTIFSSDFLYSFFGDYPRLNHNFLVLISILIITLVYASYQTKINIFSFIFYQSIFLSLITFFESNDRVISTLGQPNFLGIILVLGIIYSVENSLKNKLFHISTIFLFIGLIKTASITSIICLLIFLIFLFTKLEKQYWKYLISIAFVFFLMIFIISPVTKEKILDNMAIAFQSKDTKITDSILVRFSIWKDSLNIIFENPKNFIIGTGPETFSLHYEKNRGSEISQSSEWNSLIDKPHNYFLEVLIEQGFLGFLSLLLLLYYYYKSQSQNKIYTSIILIYLFFNWAHIFLQVIFFLEIISNLLEKKYEENNYYIKSIITIFIVANILSFKLYVFEEINPTKNYYQTKNPQIKIEGLYYYVDKNEISYYIKSLKKDYPKNLKIWFEIYNIEKKLNLTEKENTKNKIKEMRTDLIEWHEIFK